MYYMFCTCECPVMSSIVIIIFIIICTIKYCFIVSYIERGKHFIEEEKASVAVGVKRLTGVVGLIFLKKIVKIDHLKMFKSLLKH